MSQLKTVMESMVENWATMGHPAIMERFILRNGTLWAGSPLPAGIPKRYKTTKECFVNAARLTMDRASYGYVEGYGYRSMIGFPIQHAWTVQDGKVVDPTWNDPEDCEYMGVVFDQFELAQEMVKNRVYGILDTGRGINVRLMFERDPELKDIVEKIVGHPINVR